MTSYKQVEDPAFTKAKASGRILLQYHRNIQQDKWHKWVNGNHDVLWNMYNVYIAGTDDTDITFDDFCR